MALSWLCPSHIIHIYLRCHYLRNGIYSCKSHTLRGVFEVHLEYLMMTGYLYNEAWMASFSLWYSFSYIILILHGLSKHCFIFHKYTFLNHFHLLASFPYNELTTCSHSFYFSRTIISSLCMAWGHSISLVWGKMDLIWKIRLFLFFDKSIYLLISIFRNINSGIWL